MRVVFVVDGGEAGQRGHFREQHQMAAVQDGRSLSAHAGLAGFAGSAAAAAASAAAAAKSASRRAERPGTAGCNCKKSGCLKLYCDCFADGNFCEPASCRCTECANGGESELRTAVRNKYLSRNKNVFASKFAAGTGGGAGGGGVTGGSSASIAHAAGCGCKRTRCLKKYCECFCAGTWCADKCKCEGCLCTEEASAEWDEATRKSFLGLGSRSGHRSKRPRLDVAPTAVPAPPRHANHHHQQQQQQHHHHHHHQKDDHEQQRQQHSPNLGMEQHALSLAPLGMMPGGADPIDSLLENPLGGGDGGDGGGLAESLLSDAILAAPVSFGLCS